MTNQLTIPVPHKGWLPLVLIILLTLAIFIVSVIALISGWLTIFQNLFYIPIILACVYYVKRGFVFSVLLACGYFVLMAIFSQDFIVLEGALIRVLIFILVAGVITYLSIIRINAEDALKESEEFNRGLVENMPNLVVVYDHDRKIRYVNPTATTTLGYSVEEMEGTDIMAYVNPRQQTEISAAIEERFSSDRGKSLEIDLITKSGQHLTVISKGAPLHFQNKPAVLVLFADITDRKRAQEALRESEERYRSLYADSRDAVMILSPTQGFLAANPATIRLFACQNEQDFTTHTPASLSPEYQPDGARSEDKAQEMMQRALEKGSHFFVWTHRRVDGTDFPATVLLSRLESGGTQLLQATVRDITEQKRAEIALRQLSEDHKAIIDHAPAMIWYKDTKNTFVRVNPAGARAFGMAIEEIEGKSTYDLFPDFAEKYYQDDLEVINSGKPKLGIIEPMTTANGEHLWVQSDKIPLKDEQGTITGILVFAVDITERKHAEEALMESKALVDAVVENVPLMIFLKDATDLRFVIFNRAGEELLGYDRTALLGKNNLDLFPPEQAANFMNTDREVLDGDLSMLDIPEESIMTAKKGLRLLHTRKVCIRAADGTTKFLLGISEDITERKRAEDALRQVNKQLNLLSSITRHDILNQLMALKGYLYLSHEEIDNPTTLTGYIQKEEQAADAIENQIKFTRDYQELGVAAPEWQNVNASIQKAVAGLPMRAVHVEVDPKNPEVFADRLFEKVFYNLIDNALRYGGADMKTIRVSSQEIDTGLRIICEDDGVGISAEDKKKLFTKGFGKNTGLGLFLSREILAITGITITENGVLGKGARFEIAVPKGMWRMKDVNQ